MSVSRSVYVGPYLVCKHKAFSIKETAKRCPTSIKHRPAENGGEFCPKCGTRFVTEVFYGVEWRGARDLFYNTGEPWTDNIPAVDQNILTSYFNFISTEWIGGKDGYDYLTISNSGVSVDADNEGVHVFTPEETLALTQPPNQDMIDLLQQYLEYESIEVKFGALVSIS